MTYNYLAPGVYVQENSTPPDVVADVASAVPAFIGYTEQTRYDGRDLVGVPEPISSFKDFETRFGGAAPLYLEAVTVLTDEGTRFQSVDSVRFKSRFFLYQAVYMYFQNGGGDCFVVSTGGYGSPGSPGSAVSAKDKDVFLSALESLEAVDDVTLLVMPEAVLLGDSLLAVQQAALAQCAKRQNRFAILDIAETDKDTTNVLLNWSHTPNMDAWKNSCQTFRDRIGTMNLRYGAAYTPYIVADIPVHVLYGHFRDCLFKAGGGQLTLAELDPAAKPSIAELEAALTDRDIQRLSDALASSSVVFRTIVSAVQTAARVQPPSAAMAGIYAAVDRERGVWKAPANVRISGIDGLSQAITKNMQDYLNIDPVAGKSINVLRSFPGQGIRVWGARTLDGNSPEWRYVPVRRFVSMVEESIRRAATWAVFEPNDASLWFRLSGMLENYLLQKWKDGAIQGSGPADAFYVKTGSSSMTEQDLREGRLIFNVGLAVARPAEFITLRFMYTMQQL